MTIDSYAPCPCGSGKKLKFCKCLDQPQEFEKIARLIEGGQELAALDRINQLLAKTPNTAWLLAIKCELALAMQEMGTFKETAIRFLKLKPDNPLALVMRSMVACQEDEPPENAARYLLHGMSESRESFPPMTIPAIQVLVRTLAESDKLSMVGFWCDLLNNLVANPDTVEETPLRDPGLNLIAKSPARLIEDTPGAGWKERLSEVLALVRTFRYPQAETKLRVILRDFPDQPGPMSHLLRAQYAQLDQTGAYATAKKLSENLQVSADDRAYFLALAYEIEPEQKSLDTPAVVRFAEVDSDERVHQVLEGMDFAVSVEGPEADQMRHFYAAAVNDEVPAKRVFAIYDRHFSIDAKPTEGAATQDNPEIAQFVASVATFGKQTDRPARVLVIGRTLEKQQPVLDRVIDALQLGTEITDHHVTTGSPYTMLLTRAKVQVANPAVPLSIEQRGNELVEDFLNCKFAVLDNQSVLEAVQDERKRAIIRGLLVHLEGEQSIVVPQSSINEIYRRLVIPRPATKVNPQAENIQLTTIIDLDRMDVSQLSDNQLQAILGRAVSLGAYRVYYHCAAEILARPSLADGPMRIAALSGMITFMPDIEDKIKYCRELQTAIENAGAPVGRVVIQLMTLLQSSGRIEESQQFFLGALKKYPEDPYLLSFMQYVMEQSRGGMGGPTPQLGGDGLQESESGLVLPGQPEPQEGKSKLWLPGM